MAVGMRPGGGLAVFADVDPGPSRNVIRLVRERRPDLMEGPLAGAMIGALVPGWSADGRDGPGASWTRLMGRADVPSRMVTDAMLSVASAASMCADVAASPGPRRRDSPAARIISSVLPGGASARPVLGAMAEEESGIWSRGVFRGCGEAVSGRPDPRGIRGVVTRIPEAADAVTAALHHPAAGHVPVRGADMTVMILQTATAMARIHGFAGSGGTPDEHRTLAAIAMCGDDIPDRDVSANGGYAVLLPLMAVCGYAAAPPVPAWPCTVASCGAGMSSLRGAALDAMDRALARTGGRSTSPHPDVFSDMRGFILLALERMGQDDPDDAQTWYAALSDALASMLPLDRLGDGPRSRLDMFVDVSYALSSLGPESATCIMRAVADSTPGPRVAAARAADGLASMVSENLGLGYGPTVTGGLPDGFVTETIIAGL